MSVSQAPSRLLSPDDAEPPVKSDRKHSQPHSPQSLTHHIASHRVFVLVRFVETALQASR